jgi:hypothetical protein
VQPINGFHQALTFTCKALPAAATCATPTVSLDGSSAASTTITISTTARTVAASIDPLSGLLVLLLSISSIVSLNICRRGKSQNKMSSWPGLLAVLLVMVCISCGGGGSSGPPPPPPPTGTPAGTYTVTLVGTSGSISHSATVTLVVN